MGHCAIYLGTIKNNPIFGELKTVYKWKLSNKTWDDSLNSMLHKIKGIIAAQNLLQVRGSFFDFF